MLKPISITIRWLYAPNVRPSINRDRSQTSSSASGSGTLALAVSHQPESLPGRMSDFLDDMLAQQPGGFDQQDDDQDDEGDAVAVLAAVGQVADDQHLDQPQDQP